MSIQVGLVGVLVIGAVFAAAFGKTMPAIILLAVAVLLTVVVR